MTVTEESVEAVPGRNPVVVPPRRNQSLNRSCRFPFRRGVSSDQWSQCTRIEPTSTGPRGCCTRD